MAKCVVLDPDPDDTVDPTKFDMVVLLGGEEFIRRSLSARLAALLRLLSSLSLELAEDSESC